MLQTCNIFPLACFIDPFRTVLSGVGEYSPHRGVLVRKSARGWSMHVDRKLLPAYFPLPLQKVALVGKNWSRDQDDLDQAYACEVLSHRLTKKMLQQICVEDDRFVREFPD